MTRKSFSGNAIPTALTTPMLTGDSSFAVGATTNWPNTATGNFVVCVDRGLGTEEKILCSSYTSNTVTVASGGRGYDGTTAQGHTNGATVNCTIDANTIDGHDAFVAAAGTVTPAASAVGDTAVNGASGKPADASHKHAREAFATVTSTSAVGDAKSDGTSTSPARADHKHARESFATLAAGVVPLIPLGTSASGSAPGDAETPGTASTLSRSDHKHGREAATNSSLFGVGTALTGSPPAAGNGFLTQGGVVTVTFSAGLSPSLNFPVAFTNGLLSVVALMQDSGTPADFTLNLTGWTKTAFSLGATNSGSPYTGTVACTWIAIGF